MRKWSLILTAIIGLLVAPVALGSASSSDFAGPAPKPAIRLHHFSGTHNQRMVVFHTHGLAGCSPAWGRLNASGWYRALPKAAVNRTVRRHVLRIRHIGSVDLNRSRVSLDIACTGPRSTGGKPASPIATIAGGSGSGGGGGGGGGTMLFNGTFDKGLSNYAEQNGNCFSSLNSQELRFSITSLCDPGQDGRFRSDLNTRNLYRAGVPVCTSIPIRFPTGMVGVPDSTWLGFAETEDPHNPNQNDLAGWGMGLNSYYTGNTVDSPNQYQIEFADYNHAAPAWTSSGNVDTGWHTLSICTNNANDSSGVVYGIWLDGARQTFNHGPQAGSQTLSGFPIIQNDPANKTNWPLIINDYTGGTPAPNTIVHGPPLVATMGTDGLPPEQSGGWNSP